MPRAHFWEPSSGSTTRPLTACYRWVFNRKTSGGGGGGRGVHHGRVNGDNQNAGKSLPTTSPGGRSAPTHSKDRNAPPYARAWGPLLVSNSEGPRSTRPHGRLKLSDYLPLTYRSMYIIAYIYICMYVYVEREREVRESRAGPWSLAPAH